MKYIALLRGINVSGQKMIKMAELKTLLQEQGFTSVETYIQSGNIVFKSQNTDQEKIKKIIQNAVFTEFGFHVPTQILESSTLEKVFTNNPFIKQNAEITFCHVTILDKTPEKDLVKKLEGFDSGNDVFFIKENIVYLFCPGGYGKTKLTNNFFESKLKTQHYHTQLENNNKTG